MWTIFSWGGAIRGRTRRFTEAGGINREDRYFMGVAQFLELRTNCCYGEDTERIAH